MQMRKVSIIMEISIISHWIRKNEVRGRRRLIVIGGLGLIWFQELSIICMIKIKCRILEIVQMPIFKELVMKET